jgi:uncharacterized protein (TIGR02117 family)
MKKQLKYSFKLLGILVLLPVIYIFMAFILSAIPNQLAKSSGSEKIYLVSNGVHTDIVFQKSDFPELKKAGVYLGSLDKYAAIGWGDRGFYLDTPTWGDLTLSTAINAGFLKSKTLIHVTRHSTKKTKWKEVQINANQLADLKDYVLSHLKKHKQKAVKIANAHYGKKDEFYEAKGSYSIFKTCNTWVNIGLKKVKIKTALWTPFDYGILKWYE